MCGIVGCTGNKHNAVDVVTEGLEKLEYRGYDSAGIAMNIDGKTVVEKYVGRLKVLKDVLDVKKYNASCAIGHTRWATHGAPSDVNAHPHTSNDGKINVVHNGIIENYALLKEELIAKGYVFNTQTDTECAAHLISEYYEGNLLEAVAKAVKKMKGAYALCVICSDEPDRIVTVRKDSPMIVGLGDGENIVASDIPAVLKYTREVYLLDNETMCDVRPDSAKIYDFDLNPIEKETFHVTWDAEDAAKGDFPHFMIKEIYEQPQALSNTLRGRLSADSMEVTFDEFTITKEYLEKVNNIQIVACGTASYAGQAGKNMLEKYTGIRTDITIASEYRYNDRYTTDRTLFIAVSQSGETADTLASMRLAKEKGARVLAVTNVVGSSVAREAEDVIYTWAGPEIAVASTKAYSTQVLVMYMLAMKLGRLLGNISDEEFVMLRDTCLALPAYAEEALGNCDELRELAEVFAGCTDAFYIGRGLDYAIVMEGSLKMKEISYIHAEAYPAGELKHGPIALIEPGTPVVAVCTQRDELMEKTVSNIKEVAARGAYTIVFAKEGTELPKGEFNRVMYVRPLPEEMSAIPTIINLQILAYYAAVANKCDVDKPRNLAKSVTVE